MPFSGDTKAQVVLLFGPPGSGKGTIGAMICAAGSHFHLSSGQIFRRLSPESQNGKLFHDYASQGKLVPDEVTIEIWQRYTQGLIDTNRYFPSQQLLLLDGIPRTARQTEMLRDFIDVLHIIALDVNNSDILVERVSRRARIEKRLDDANPELLKKRIDEYAEKSVKVLDCYPKDIIHHYNAEQSPMEVLRDVLVGSTDVLKAMPHTMPRSLDAEFDKPAILSARKPV
ncbi:MAG: nucleoside monophosphate kinase [Myxococcota bacterium]